MNRLKIGLASFLLVNSFTFAENLTEFQTKVVKDLYNKGILQTIVKEEDFSKKDNFSRGEIATIIYNTISLNNATSLKNASPTDLTIIKALISDFSSELAKLGAKDYELIDIINNEKNILNKRIDTEVSVLNKKIDRINVTGDFTLIKEFNKTSGQNELMKDFTGEGEIALNLNISDEIKGKIAYDLALQKAEYALDIKNKDFDLLVFNDEAMTTDDWADLADKNRRNSSDVVNKKLPNFDNGLGIVDKAGINNIDTIVLSKKLGAKEILSLVTSTETEDIYGIQYKSPMPYFMTTPDANANMLISNVWLDDKTSTTNDKRFLILGADFNFPINPNASQSLVYNYSKMRESSSAVTPAGTDYFLPVISDEATYVNAKTEIKSQKLGKVEVVLGAVNTGYNYDASKLSDNEKEMFSQSDLIKLDKNIFGGIASFKNTKDAFENTLSSISYKTNNDKTNDVTEDDTTNDTTTRVDTLYTVNDKVKLGIGIGQNRTTNYDSGTTDYSTYDRMFVEGQIKLKDVISPNSSNLIKLKYGIEDNYNKNELVAYGDYRKTIDNANIVLASEYEDSAEQKTLKTAFYYEKNGKLNDKYTGNVLFGGKYNKDYVADASNSDNYQAFTKADVNVKENINLEGGVRYSKGGVENNGKTFALGLTYKYDENFKVGLVYGPIDVLDDYSKDIFEYKTDGVYGETKERLGSIKISGKF